MLIRPHKKAAATPATREYIRTCGKGVKTLAREPGLNPATVRKWRGRESVEDASHRPHTMQTTLTPRQEALGHYRDLYNGRIPQRALGHVSPLQALEEWREKGPERFVREIHNQPGLDSPMSNLIVHRAIENFSLRNRILRERVSKS